MEKLARAVAVAAALVAANAWSQTGARRAPRAFSAAHLVAPPTADWPTNGGNLYNQRYSSLALIDRGNVGELKGVWRTRLNGSGFAPQYSGEGQPIVYDGVAYVSTGA